MRNDFSHVSSNFAENLMSKHEYGQSIIKWQDG